MEELPVDPLTGAFPVELLTGAFPVEPLTEPFADEFPEALSLRLLF